MPDNQIIRMKKLSPVMFVKEMKPCINFWKDRLGFDVILEMSDGHGMGIVVLQKDNNEIVVHALRRPETAVSTIEPASTQSRMVLYMEVESLSEVLARVHGVEVVMPLRKSFYGAAEIAIREPGGNVVCFSQNNASDAPKRQWKQGIDERPAIAHF